MDSTIAGAFQNLIEGVNQVGLPITVNNTFRTTEEQTKLYEQDPGKANPPGMSLHEAGFAVDLNGASGLSSAQRSTLVEIAKQNGFDPVSKEKWHFQADPTKHGYKNRGEAIKENQADYKKKQGEKKKKSGKGAGGPAAITQIIGHSDPGHKRVVCHDGVNCE